MLNKLKNTYIPMDLNEFLKKRKIYEMNKQLTEEQYNFLMEKEEEFHTLITANYCRNLSQSWLNKMKEVYIDLFQSNVNIKCPACVFDALRQLHNKMEQYRQSLVTKEKEVEIKEIKEPKTEDNGTRISERTGDKPSGKKERSRK